MRRFAQPCFDHEYIINDCPDCGWMAEVEDDHEIAGTPLSAPQPEPTDMTERVATVLKLNFPALVEAAQAGNGDWAADEVAGRIVATLRPVAGNEAELVEALVAIAEHDMGDDLNTSECSNCHDKGFEHYWTIKRIARTALAAHTSGGSGE